MDIKPCQNQHIRVDFESNGFVLTLINNRNVYSRPVPRYKSWMSQKERARRKRATRDYCKRNGHYPIWSEF